METRQPHAVVPPLFGGAARDSGVPVRLQWFVEMGAEQADTLLPVLSAINLHSRLADLSKAFRRTFVAEAAARGSYDEGAATAATDAFIAGLLGRLQQHLIAHAAPAARAAGPYH